MASDEFTIIERYFTAIGKAHCNTQLGIGDDAAVLDLPVGHQLVVSMDTLIQGVHFPIETHPSDIAYKSLVVNLSDLAAMAAEPVWFLLSITLPDSRDAWLKDFSMGLKQAAERYPIQLVGGDTCRGPLSVTIQAGGQVPVDAYIRRDKAEVGDLILITGTLGNAALGLAEMEGKIELTASEAETCRTALNRPRPRLELTPFLREFAHSAIDLSDGLQSDLGHLLNASGCGAMIDQRQIPVNDWIKQSGHYQYALNAGDDYEICCTIGARHRAAVRSWNLQHPDCFLSVIGKVTQSGFQLQADDQVIELDQSEGYRHF